METRRDKSHKSFRGFSKEKWRKAMSDGAGWLGCQKMGRIEAKLSAQLRPGDTRGNRCP